ncbi:glycosyltransferase family 2 protein [bacterium]|nr:glycosyltransferase family 2 protein [candidate division CSSED10-310 bacterium]
MDGQYSLSMVFPAYNEQDNLERLIADADRASGSVSDDYEIIIVDDGSTDRTPEILARLKESYPNLVVHTHKPNRGYTAALRTGFAGATKDLVFYSDADNQFDLQEIGLLMEKIEGNDIVVGYRKDRQDPWIRIFVSRCFNILSHAVFKFSVRDVDCAFKLFRRNVFDEIKINSEHFMVDTEIMSKAVLYGYRVAEVGVTHLPRTAGQTTVKPTDVIKTLRGMIWLHTELRRLKKQRSPG